MSELGNTAKSAIDALRSSPVVLGLILLNVIFLVAVFYSVRQQRAQEFELTKRLTDLVADCAKEQH